MKRVLLISYFFPPEGGPGTQRCAKFAKYLPSFGYEPIVLTRTPRDKGAGRSEDDPTLLKDIGADTCVLRVAGNDEPRWWARSVPDLGEESRGWMEAALEVARGLFERGRIDAALVTMSPFELSYLGERIQRDLSVPVILDLRDPWAIDGCRLRGSWLRWMRDWRAMSHTLPAAEGVIANTEEARREMLRRVPGLKASRLVTIPNGFDEEDFRAPAASIGSKIRGSHMCICHVGTLHTGELYKYEGALGLVRRFKHYRPEPIDMSGRTEFHLLRALKLLRDQRDPCVDRVRVTLVGSANEASKRCIGESGVADLVETRGYVSHAEAIDWLRRSDVLFVPLYGLPPGHRSLIVPGKVYECLRAGRPILGCLPSGEARELVERSGAGACVDPCDAPGIANAIRGLVSRWERGELRATAPAPWLRHYERRSLTANLAAFLDRVTAPQGEPQVDAMLHGRSLAATC